MVESCHSNTIPYYSCRLPAAPPPTTYLPEQFIDRTGGLLEGGMEKMSAS